MNSQLIPPRTGLPQRPHGSRRVLGVMMFLAAAGGLAGCGASSSSPAATATTGGGAPPSGSPANSAGSVPAATAPAAATGSASDACSLITHQEASAAFGVDAGTPMPQDISATKLPPQDSECLYRAGDHTLSIRLIRVNAKAFFDGEKMVPGTQDVAGLGDKAFSSYGTLEILKGSNNLLIGLDATSASKQVSPAEITLAKAALGRL